MAAPSLAIADQQDGTGATATVTGGDAGATNQIWVQAGGNGTLVLAGSRTGPGTVDLTLSLGMYWGHVLSISGDIQTVSNITRFDVTGSLSSPHYDCLLAIRNRIIDLGLPRIGSNVVVRPLPESEATLEFPCVLVTPIESDSFRRDTTCTFIAGFPVTVILCDRRDPDDRDLLQEWLYWRWKINESLMSSNKLATVSGSMRTEIQPSSVLAEKLKDYQYIRSYLVLVCQIQKTRS